MLLFSKLILLILGFFVFICKASRICSYSLSILCAIIVVFSTKIFWKLDLGIEWFLRCKAMELESFRCIVSCKMAYEVSESAWGNFGKFIYQFQPETKTLIRKLDMILNKLYRQNLSLVFNETCLNEQQLPNYTHTYVYIYIYIYTHTHTVIFSVSCFWNAL